MQIGILASGNGTNAENLIRHFKNDKFINVSCVVTDKLGGGVIERCHQLGVPIKICEKVEDRISHEFQIIKVLKEYNVDWVILAGYMRILSRYFLNHFYDSNLKSYRVANIHPSLLPDYPGLNSYKRAYEDKVKIAGVTVHLVDAGVDTGPIVLQKSFNGENYESFVDFEERGRKIEMELYPLAIKKLFQLENNL